MNIEIQEYIRLHSISNPVYSNHRNSAAAFFWGADGARLEVLRRSDSALYWGRKAGSRWDTPGTEGCREMEDRENQGPQYPYQSLGLLRRSRGMHICAQFICIKSCPPLQQTTKWLCGEIHLVNMFVMCMLMGKSSCLLY